MIRLEHITKTYVAGDTVVKALNDVSINFREKEFVSILGPSGCGKTTLLNILGGLDRYDSGDICVNDVTTKDFKDKDWDAYRNHYIGFVFQNYNLIPHLSVVENVELALSIGGTPKKQKREKALNALKQVGLLEQAKKRPNQLSGGQMQRVAIARAIVNDPEIILADEPTGALDSETSVQVMDILKDISKNHLVIMVTHNKELAEKYSTRIINLFDGKMIGDSKPYKPRIKKVKQENKKPKSAMSILTAFALSFKNLFTKKAKTILISFAGSIGIIGIALVLAVSTGFSNYINRLQSDTLSGYPISVSTITVNLSTMTEGLGANGESLEEFPDGDHIIVNNPLANLASLSKYNYISPNYIEYVKEYEKQDLKKSKDKREINSISYSYEAPLHLLSEKNGEITVIENQMATSTLTGATSASFYEGLTNKDFVLSQYDVLYGTYPSNKFEVALVISETNSLPVNLLNTLNFDLSYNESGFNNINFSDIAGQNGKTYRIATNNVYYKPVYNAGEIESFNINTDASQMYQDSSELEIKISCVLRVKKDAPLSIYNEGIVYSPELTQYLNEIEQNSLIVKEQRKQTDKLFVKYSFNATELNITQSYNSISEMKQGVKQFYNVELSTEQCIEYVLQNLNASSIPVAIRIYAKNFEAKDNIVSYLNAWNTTDEGKANPIEISDATAILSSTMGVLVDTISYVLIAFAGISLVVSSIMIGIITYTSVIERTKEIGVLRSIGARKKDISRVFNMETFIIGLTAGILGVGITFGLTFPISALFKSLGGGAITTNLAMLRVDHMIILTLISVLLTFIAGLVPSRIAAKKDPVKALRTE